MPKIVYVEADGTRHEVEVPAGMSAMQGAVNNGVPGILGDCGGSCSCATCHVFVPQAWQQTVGGAQAAELDLLEIRDDHDPDASRLGCQITISDALDGLELRLPHDQF